MLGLDADYKTLHKEDRDDADTFQLHLTQLVERAVGLAATANVTTQVHVVDGRALCRVHVEPAGHPVTVKVSTPTGMVEKFFVRINNSTKAFDVTERQRYLVQRWGGNGRD